MSVFNLYPTLRPTLSFDFVNAGVLDPSVTFTRTTNATYFDETGILRVATPNTPRFDFTPSTLAPLGFLIEEARTNIVASSVYTANTNGWTNGVIGGTGTIVAAAVNSPSGTTSGVFNISGLNGSSYVGQFATVTASANARTGSVFVRNNGGVKFQIRLVFQTGGTFASYGTEYDFNTTAFQDGIAGTTAPTSRSVTNVGNGWLRITITASDNGTGNTQAALQFWGTATTTNYNYLMWGAQIEEASAGASAAFATSYIPTTTTALTRSADVASVNTLTPWYNSAAGTWYAEFLVPQANTSAFWRILSGDVSNRPQLFNNGGFNWEYSADGSVFLGTPVANTITKIAGNYAANSVNMAVNGVLGTEDTSATLNAPTAFRLGAATSTSNREINGYLRRISYYPVRLSNAQLQTLTA